MEALEKSQREWLAKLDKRIEFVAQYAKDRGWEEPFSMEQVLEVRSQDGWKFENL